MALPSNTLDANVSLPSNNEIQSLLSDALFQADAFNFSDLEISDSGTTTTVDSAAGHNPTSGLADDASSTSSLFSTDLFDLSLGTDHAGNIQVAQHNEAWLHDEVSYEATASAEKHSVLDVKLHVDAAGDNGSLPGIAPVSIASSSVADHAPPALMPLAPFDAVVTHAPEPSPVGNNEQPNLVAALPAIADGDSAGVLVDGDGQIVASMSNSVPHSGGATSGGSGGSTPATGSGSAAVSPFVINIGYDSSVNGAPAGFKAAVAAAVQYFESQFVDPVSINIAVGYGEVGGYTLGAGALGESLTYLHSFSYSQIDNSLTLDAKSADDAMAVASLPTSSPVNGTFWESTADAKATGLLGSSSSLDGYVGFASGNLFDYDNSNGVTAGQYDFFGVFAHEISEVMGRSLLVGGSIGSTPNGYYALDLFHYSASGVRDFAGGTPGYFSINGGTTNLDSFNTNPGGDYGDWAASAGNDAFLAFSPSGVVDAVSQTDLREMDILGWDRASSVTIPTPPPGQPDLVATNFAFNGTHFSYHVGNIGTGSAAASTAGIYAGTSVASLGSLIGTMATGALAAGTSDTESGTLVLSTNSSPATYYLSVVADYKNGIVESNESNNTSNKIAIIVGNSGANTFTGTAGNDVIFGLGGNDTLTGGTGADQFVFNTALRSNSVATITDFTTAQGDKLSLDHTIFSALTPGAFGSALAASDFYASANGAAHLATDHILYNTTTGALSYDADGTGTAAAVQFATLAHHPALTANDFLLA